MVATMSELARRRPPSFALDDGDPSVAPSTPPTATTMKKSAIRMRFESHLPKYGSLWRSMAAATAATVESSSKPSSTSSFRSSSTSSFGDGDNRTGVGDEKEVEPDDDEEENDKENVSPLQSPIAPASISTTTLTKPSTSFKSPAKRNSDITATVDDDSAGDDVALTDDKSHHPTSLLPAILSGTAVSLTVKAGSCDVIGCVGDCADPVFEDDEDGISTEDVTVEGRDQDDTNEGRNDEKAKEDDKDVGDDASSSSSSLSSGGSTVVAFDTSHFFSSFEDDDASSLDGDEKGGTLEGIGKDESNGDIMGESRNRRDGGEFEAERTHDSHSPPRILEASLASVMSPVLAPPSSPSPSEEGKEGRDGTVSSSADDFDTRRSPPLPPSSPESTDAPSSPSSSISSGGSTVIAFDTSQFLSDGDLDGDDKSSKDGCDTRSRRDDNTIERPRTGHDMAGIDQKTIKRDSLLMEQAEDDKGENSGCINVDNDASDEPGLPPSDDKKEGDDSTGIDTTKAQHVGPSRRNRQDKKGGRTTNSRDMDEDDGDDGDASTSEEEWMDGDGFEDAEGSDNESHSSGTNDDGAGRWGKRNGKSKEKTYQVIILSDDDDEEEGDYDDKSQESYVNSESIAGNANDPEDSIYVISVDSEDDNDSVLDDEVFSKRILESDFRTPKKNGDISLNRVHWEEEDFIVDNDDSPAVRSRTPKPRSKVDASRSGGKNKKKESQQKSGIAFCRKRVEITSRTFEDFNQRAFGGALATVEVTWSKRLLKTAGLTRLMRFGPATDRRRIATIELSEKVIDDESRLRATLLHEMCHAAAWLVDGNIKPPHGNIFKKWANQSMKKIKDVIVTTTHDYQITYKYAWACTAPKCGKVIKRHSRSVDVKKHCCGSCGGVLTEIESQVSGVQHTPKEKRPPTGFSLFVKENSKAVRQKLEKCSSTTVTQPEVMKECGRLWREKKDKKTTNDWAASGEDAREGTGGESGHASDFEDLQRRLKDFSF